MENNMRKMQNDFKNERKINRRKIQKIKVRFPSHTTNVYHSTFIQPSTVLLSPQTTYPSSNNYEFFLFCILGAMILIILHLSYQKLQ